MASLNNHQRKYFFKCPELNCQSEWSSIEWKDSFPPEATCPSCRVGIASGTTNKDLLYYGRK